jgi:hypothetical protein
MVDVKFENFLITPTRCVDVSSSRAAPIRSRLFVDDASLHRLDREIHQPTAWPSRRWFSRAVWQFLQDGERYERSDALSVRGDLVHGWPRKPTSTVRPTHSGAGADRRPTLSPVQRRH